MKKIIITFLYLLAIFLAFFSWGENMRILSIPESHAYDCDIHCKKSIMLDIGITDELASSIVWRCKEMTRDPVHCIKYATSVSMAESSGGHHCHNGGCFGIHSGKIAYEHIDAGVVDWITRYNKYWYKARSVSDFYPPRGEWSKFRYCTSEHSSNSSIGCPNGLKYAGATFEKLTF